MNTLNPKQCGLALGCTIAIGMIALALISLFHGHYGNTLIGIISSGYLGYDNTIPGALIGGIWGFVDGFVGGYLFAWFYNKFAQ